MGSVRRKLGDLVLVRHRRNFILLARFGAVGLSGVLVNMLALVVVYKLGPGHDSPIVGLPFSDFNVRWYHAYSTIAFLVANLWNFQLNRTWAFQTTRHAAWWKEYWPFLAVGLLGVAAVLAGYGVWRTAQAGIVRMEGDVANARRFLAGTGEGTSLDRTLAALP